MIAPSVVARKMDYLEEELSMRALKLLVTHEKILLTWGELSTDSWASWIVGWLSTSRRSPA